MDEYPTTFLTTVCTHVTNGGALPEFCKSLKLPYNHVITWIYSNSDRAAAYEAAQRARGEWFIQSILNELKDIALADIRQAYDQQGNLLSPDQWPDSLARVVQAVETEEIYDGRGKDRQPIGTTKRLKMWDKLRALELLGKNLRMFKEEVEHSGTLSLEALVEGSMKPDEPTQGQTSIPSSGQIEGPRENGIHTVS